MFEETLTVFLFYSCSKNYKMEPKIKFERRGENYSSNNQNTSKDIVHLQVVCLHIVPFSQHLISRQANRFKIGYTHFEPRMMHASSTK